MKQLLTAVLFALAPISQASAQIAQPLVRAGELSYLEIHGHMYQPQDVTIVHRELVPLFFVTIVVPADGMQRQTSNHQ